MSLALLVIQAEAALDAHGRWRNCGGVVIASAADGQALWIGDRVAVPVAAALEEAFARAPRPAGPDDEPPALAACAAILGEPLVRITDPCYELPPDVRFPIDAPILRSGDPGAADALRGANPGDWHPIEWNELIDGQLGPWAIVARDGRAISLCHTPRVLTARAAEAGVWTDLAHRGRGLAAGVTAAWAELVRAPGRHLFYSTTTTNLSSQRVASRLGLRRFGWTWRVVRPEDPAASGSEYHALSSLAAPRPA